MRIAQWPILALLSVGAIWAAPSYTAAGVVNAIDYSAGPFAPNSVVTIFGSGLSYGTVASAITTGDLAIELNYTRVYVDGVAAPLLYVSPTQINFLIPMNHVPGNAVIHVYCEGVYGPDVTLQVVNAAPTFIPAGNGYVAATHADGSLITPDTPAHAGEPVVAYLTGLGLVDPFYGALTIPRAPAWIATPAGLKVLIAGAAVDPSHVFYAGVTPYFAGLYQINFFLPDPLGSNPEIRVSLGTQTSTAGMMLAVK